MSRIVNILNPVVYAGDLSIVLEWKMTVSPPFFFLFFLVGTLCVHTFPDVLCAALLNSMCLSFLWLVRNMPFALLVLNALGVGSALCRDDSCRNRLDKKRNRLDTKRNRLDKKRYREPKG